MKRILFSVFLACGGAGAFASEGTGGVSAATHDAWGAAVEMARCSGVQAALADAYGALNRPEIAAGFRSEASLTASAAQRLFFAAAVAPAHLARAVYDHALLPGQRVAAAFAAGGRKEAALAGGLAAHAQCEATWRPVRDHVLEAARKSGYRSGYR